MALQGDWCEVLRARFQMPSRYANELPDYPPATEDQLRLTEERLGFVLPSTLRRLYAEVANGGDVFRTGAIVRGVVDGCPGFYLPDPTGTLDQGVCRSGWRLNEQVDNALRRHHGAYVQSEAAADCFVSICDDGSDIAIDLDGLTGRLYHRWCGDNMLSYRVSLGLPIEAGMENAYMQAISFYAESVDVWIEHELNHIRPLSGQTTELTQDMLLYEGT